ncbi:Gfo/Idh/MocA family protein [Paenibacillus methanolicus]|uniref:Putative dehydrogenase n=1 Tax=Paenibacillus methanolicus TaxID=582686 RepID=A0A5S5BRH4_9BACL|nr:Gfo/Idh/MocA family oxidoreductase [Paenibacillus methanolicus]TYP69805.1 putative dehydrogenase [Paenibacillus methanolicus]
MDTIKIGIVGGGFIGPAHVEAVRRLGFVEVKAIAGSCEERAEQKAAELGIPDYYGDYRELLRDPEIVAVHNCTPNDLHFEINRAIMLAGKHVLSEKPLALNSRESGELLRLARSSGIVHGVNFNYRQFPILQQLSAMVERGELGDIHLIQGSYLQDWLLYDTDYSWRLDPKIGGATRAVADIGSHWCDTVQYVSGKRISEVCADFSTVIPVRRKALQRVTTFETSAAEVAAGSETDAYEDYEVETEDTASVLIRFEDGSKGSFTVSQVSAGRKNKLSFELSGSRQSAFWNQEEPQKLWIGHRDKPNEVLLADPSLFAEEARGSIHLPGGHNEGWPDALKNNMLQFYTFIREGRDPASDAMPFATFEDGHRSMRIVDAILSSHQEGRWVKVSELL